MNIDGVREKLQERCVTSFDFYERRPGQFQIILPICHEDGDMIEMYLVTSPCGNGYIRICDFGLSLMRLSYTYEVNTVTRQSILDSIIINNGVSSDSDNLYIDSNIESVYEGILQFAGCVQKICNLRYWHREVTQNVFYEDLASFVSQDLVAFAPVPDQAPLAEYPIISIDWTLTWSQRTFYLFGVSNNDKAKNVSICLLELQKAQVNFISLVVHRDIEKLGRRERLHLTKNADIEYVQLDDFCQKADSDVRRVAVA